VDLNELNEKLYKEKNGIEKRENAPKQFEPGWGHDNLNNGRVEHDWEKEPSAVAQQPILPEIKKINFKPIAAGLVTLVLIAVGLWYFISSRTFDTKKVDFEIFSRDRIVSGELVSYVVKYKNNSGVALKKVKLTFIYPVDSQPTDKSHLTNVGGSQASVIDLPDLANGQEGQTEFRANVGGQKDETKKAAAKLSYQPGSLASDFENSTEFSNVIFSVPVVLDFDLPERVANGQPLNFSLKYLNTSDISFSDLVLNLDLPSGFSLSSSLPASDSGNSWRIVEIGPREEGKILLSGSLTGLQDEVKTFKATISQADISDGNKVISQGQASTLVSVAPLAIQLSLNNSRDYSANVGETLNYVLDYKNTVDVPIGPVYIIVKLDSATLNISTLETEDGSLNSIDNSVTWNESILPDLKMIQPGEERKLTFKIKVKDKLPVANFSNKNFVINVSAKIDSPNVPISLVGTQLTGNDTLSTKINSRLALSAKGYFNDSLIPNSGPIPPTVGQQTTYTIYWRVVNLANDVDNVIVETYLPPYISWKGVYQPQNNDLKYDSVTGKVTWTIGKLAANSGVLSLVKQVAFQIGLTPNINQVNQQPILVKDSSISGIDLFTNVSLSGSSAAITTNLSDDPTVGYQGSIVKN